MKETFSQRSVIYTQLILVFSIDVPRIDDLFDLELGIKQNTLLMKKSPASNVSQEILTVQIDNLKKQLLLSNQQLSIVTKNKGEIQKEMQKMRAKIHSLSKENNQLRLINQEFDDENNALRNQLQRQVEQHAAQMARLNKSDDSMRLDWQQNESKLLQEIERIKKLFKQSEDQNQRLKLIIQQQKQKYKILAAQLQNKDKQIKGSSAKQQILGHQNSQLKSSLAQFKHKAEESSKKLNELARQKQNSLWKLSQKQKLLREQQSKMNQKQRLLRQQQSKSGQYKQLSDSLKHQVQNQRLSRKLAQQQLQVLRGQLALNQANFKSVLDQQKSQIEAVNQARSGLIAKISLIQQQLNKLKFAKIQDSATIQRNNKLIEYLNSTSKGYQDKITQLNSDLKNRMSDSQKHQFEVIELSRKLKDSLQKVQQLTTLNQTYRQQLNRLNGLRSFLQLKLSNESQQLSRISLDLQNNIILQENQQRLLKNKDQSITQLRDKIKHLQSEKQSESNSKVDFQIKLSQAGIKQQQLISQLQNYKNLAARLQKHGQTLQRRIAQLQNELQRLKNKGDLTAQLNNQKQIQHKVLIQKLHSSIAQKAKLQNLVSTKDDQLQNLKYELNQTRSRWVEFKDKYKAESEYQKLQFQAAIADLRAQSQSQIQELNSELANYKEKISKVKEEMTAIQTLNKQLKSKLSIVSQQSNALTQKISSQRAKAAQEFKLELVKREEQLSASKRQILKLQNDKSGLQLHLKKQIAQKGRLGEEIQKLLIQCQSSKNQLQNKQFQLRVSQKEIETLKEKLKASQSYKQQQISNLIKSNAQQREKLNFMESRMNEYQKISTRAKKQCQQLESGNLKLREQNVKLSNANNQLRQHISNQKQPDLLKAKLQDQIKQLTFRLSLSQTNYKSLHQEIEQLKNKIEKSVPLQLLQEKIKIIMQISSQLAQTKRSLGTSEFILKQKAQKIKHFQVQLLTKSIQEKDLKSQISEGERLNARLQQQNRLVKQELQSLKFAVQLQLKASTSDQYMRKSQVVKLIQISNQKNNIIQQLKQQIVQIKQQQTQLQAIKRLNLQLSMSAKSNQLELDKVLYQLGSLKQQHAACSSNLQNLRSFFNSEQSRFIAQRQALLTRQTVLKQKLINAELKQIGLKQGNARLTHQKQTAQNDMADLKRMYIFELQSKSMQPVVVRLVNQQDRSCLDQVITQKLQQNGKLEAQVLRLEGKLALKQKQMQIQMNSAQRARAQVRKMAEQVEQAQQAKIQIRFKLEEALSRQNITHQQLVTVKARLTAEIRNLQQLYAQSSAMIKGMQSDLDESGVKICSLVAHQKDLRLSLERQVAAKIKLLNQTTQLKQQLIKEQAERRILQLKLGELSRELQQSNNLIVSPRQKTLPFHCDVLEESQLSTIEAFIKMGGGAQNEHRLQLKRLQQVLSDQIEQTKKEKRKNEGLKEQKLRVERAMQKQRQSTDQLRKQLRSAQETAKERLDECRALQLMLHQKELTIRKFSSQRSDEQQKLHKLFVQNSEAEKTIQLMQEKLDRSNQTIARLELNAVESSDSKVSHFKQVFQLKEAKIVELTQQIALRKEQHHKTLGQLRALYTEVSSLHNQIEIFRSKIQSREKQNHSLQEQLNDKMLQRSRLQLINIQLKQHIGSLQNKLQQQKQKIRQLTQSNDNVRQQQKNSNIKLNQRVRLLEQQCISLANQQLYSKKVVLDLARKVYQQACIFQDKEEKSFDLQFNVQQLSAIILQTVFQLVQQLNAQNNIISLLSKTKEQLIARCKHWGLSPIQDIAHGDIIALVDKMYSEMWQKTCKQIEPLLSQIKILQQHIQKLVHQKVNLYREVRRFREHPKRGHQQGRLIFQQPNARPFILVEELLKMQNN